MSDTSKLIAEQNDVFRRTIGLPLSREARGVPGQMFFTPGISALPLEIQAEIVHALMAFDAFDAGNDPYGEHDFGALEVAGAGQILWKFDYYDQELVYGSEDPSDLTLTMRVLTVMLASEY